MRLTTLAISFFALSCALAGARENSLEAMVMERGKCNSLQSLKENLSDRCSNVLVNTSYKDGRTGFYFVTSDGMAITFSGNGNSQVMPNPDEAIQPVDMVIFGRSHEKQKAVGVCRFANPFHGSSNVECRADTAIGSFSGSFTTDGSEPSVKHF